MGPVSVLRMLSGIVLPQNKGLLCDVGRPLQISPIGENCGSSISTEEEAEPLNATTNFTITFTCDWMY